MTTATITDADIVKRYADELAYVAEKEKATDLGTLIDQLDTAARNFAMAGINGHEDMETASVLLGEAVHVDDDTVRAVFLGRADDLLYPIVWDMTSEYRDMVGDGDEDDD